MLVAEPVCVCVCTGDGRELQALRVQFLRRLKEVCPAKTPRRKLLVDGFVVARVEARPEDDDIDAFLEYDDPVVIMYLHIGKMRLSPYKATLQLLDQQQGNNDPTNPEGHLHVKAKLHHFPTHLQSWAKFLCIGPAPECTPECATGPNSEHNLACRIDHRL